jgi:hypothetical protein
LSDEQEEKERRELMGWSLTSKMPAHYQKRKIREDAAKTSRENQQHLMGLARKGRKHSAQKLSETEMGND